MYFDSVGQNKPPRTVDDLEIGEVAWIISWAISCDEDGNAIGFDKKYHPVSIHPEPRGTADVRVIKRGEDDYVIDFTEMGKHYRGLESREKGR